MASSAIPLTPRRSPTALVTKSTICRPKIRFPTSTLRKETDHGRQDVRQSACEFEHDDDDRDGDAHDAAARTSLSTINQEKSCYNVPQSSSGTEKCISPGGYTWDVRLTNGKHARSRVCPINLKRVNWYPPRSGTTNR